MRVKISAHQLVTGLTLMQYFGVYITLYSCASRQQKGKDTKVTKLLYFM